MKSKISGEIPVFFSVDDSYVPFLDVAIRSIIANAEGSDRYRITVLNTGLDEGGILKIKRQESDGVAIDFVDVSERLCEIKGKLRNVYHYGLATYYRLFISSMFPSLKRIIYLDCDTVVLGSLAELYATDLKGRVMAGVPDQFVGACDEFALYTKSTLGIDAADYVNAGMLLIDLDRYREERIEERFIDLLLRYNFESVAPDQDYLNFLCKGKILKLPVEWNAMPLPRPREFSPRIVHYNLYKKPWQYDDVVGGDYFWQYARSSPFYDVILKIKQAFGEEQRKEKDESGVRIKEHALEIVKKGKTFYNTLCLGK